MTTPDHAALVLKARQALKQWDDGSAAGEIVAVIRHILTPLQAKTSSLTADAREKLEQVHAGLDLLAAGGRTMKEVDALDTLMLGLWIRIELLSDSIGADGGDKRSR